MTQGSLRNYYNFSVLLRVSIAEKKYHGHGNSHRGKHLTGPGMHCRKHGTDGAGEVVESSPSGSAGSRRRL